MELYFRYPCQGEYIFFLGIQYKERGEKSCFQHFSDDQIDFKEAYLAEDSVIPLKHSWLIKLIINVSKKSYCYSC